MLVFCASAEGQDSARPAVDLVFADSADSLPDAPLPQVTAPPETKNPDETTLRNAIPHIVRDQAGIWTSPVRLRAHDLVWLAPLAVATGAAIATDHRVLTSVVSHDATFNHASVDASNVLTAGLIVAPVALYGVGHLHEDAHAREAGILSAEALLDGLVVEQGLKLVFWRERPGAHNARGRFFQSAAGVDSSFPSSHSMLAWSSAAVIAQEYPSRWVQIGVYSAAAGVGITRILGQEHFPSDVLVGSAVGWLVGRYVYHRHHRIRMH
jgi:membrane-associated phospholipid phosphatase